MVENKIYNNIIYIYYMMDDMHLRFYMFVHKYKINSSAGLNVCYTHICTERSRRKKGRFKTFNSYKLGFVYYLVYLILTKYVCFVLCESQLLLCRKADNFQLLVLLQLF